MFEDLLKEDELELDLSDIIKPDNEEEQYEICPHCDQILTGGQECDCKDGEECDDCGCVGVGCCKK
jgi:hypothetical protein